MADETPSEMAQKEALDAEARQTKRRKIEHIEICLREDVQCHVSTMFEDISFIHNSLPEIDKAKIDLTTNFFGLHANAPVIIAGMTGGHPDTLDINRRLAEAAEELRIPIGVGSQRAAIEDQSLTDTFRVVRDAAPSVPIIANLGATHVELAPSVVDMIDADVLAIHLNPLQEAIQPEGDCDSTNVLDNIREITESIDIPVIAKETGAGISSEVAKALESVGVDGVDVGGVGGTSWAAVEYYRALLENDEIKGHLGEIFWDWGISTALSVILVVDSTDLDVIATGGIRSGLDVAKAISLGAVSSGVAYPLLQSAVHGETEDVILELEKIIEGIKVALYLTGSSKVEDLRECPLIISGNLLEALQSIDVEIRKYTRS